MSTYRLDSPGNRGRRLPPGLPLCRAGPARAGLQPLPIGQARLWGDAGLGVLGVWSRLLWRVEEERPLLPSGSCALERRVAAMRAMLLVPAAISLRAWALSPASAAVLGVGVPGSWPAGEHSLETSVFMLWKRGFCGERCSSGPSAAPGWAPKQTQRQGSRSGHLASLGLISCL